MTNSKTPPKYNIGIVESVLLEVAADLDPQHLTVRELLLRIVSDANDNREMETAAQAITNLREFGLFCNQENEIVQPTPAALRARELLA